MMKWAYSVPWGSNVGFIGMNFGQLPIRLFFEPDTWIREHN